jgi:dimeric dUTPase (all-alpha-NTP-PPase superfamily)
MLDTLTIDSTKIRIPFDSCQVINQSLLSTWLMVNEETGEISSTEFKSNCYTTQTNGIKLRIGIEGIKTSVSDAGGHPVTSRFITMVITSKMLEKGYFNGITQDTLPTVYKYLMNLNVFSCSYDVFCNSMVTDTDICKDFNATFQDMRELMKSMEKHSTPYSAKGVGVRAYLNGDNQNGIEWNDRNTTSLRHTFAKVYSKYLDMFGKGIKQDRRDFAKAYINPNDCKDRYRVEVTIKNRKAFKAYGITNTTLLDIVSLSQEKMSEMVSKSINKNIEKPSRTPNQPKEGMTPAEAYTYNWLTMSLEFIPYGILINEVTEGMSNHSRSKYTKKVDTIYKKYIKGKETYKTENIDRLMKSVGWVV